MFKNNPEYSQVMQSRLLISKQTVHTDYPCTHDKVVEEPSCKNVSYDAIQLQDEAQLREATARFADSSPSGF